MTILLYIIAGLFILIGAGCLATKSHHPTLRQMGMAEHVTLCLLFLSAGVASVVTAKWSPIVVGYLVIGAMRIICNRRRQFPDSPPLPQSEFSNPDAVNHFVDWWLANDPQVSEVASASTERIWNEGYRPENCTSDFSTPSQYFRDAFQCRVIRLQEGSEQEWIDDIGKISELGFEFLAEEMRIGEQFGVDFKPFRYDAAVRQMVDPDALHQFMRYRLSEILTSNQNRLIMWLFHTQFNKWYTPDLRRSRAVHSC